MGWSAGGSAVLDTVQTAGVQTALDLPQGGFKAAVAWYPVCPSSASFEAPLLLLIGEKDDWTPPAPCAEMVKSARKQGAPATLNVYAGATHAFDMPRFYGPYSEGHSQTFRGHFMVSNPKATEQAKTDLKRFLDQYLKGAASAE